MDPWASSAASWAGRASDVVLTSTTDPADQFRMHLRGHDIVRAVFDALRAGPVTSDDGMETVPDLDTATSVLLTGTSAGAGGITNNGDFLAGQLAAGVDVWLVFDAGLRGDVDDITDGAVVAGLEQAYQAGHVRNATMNPFGDESCLAAHPAYPWRCDIDTHVRLHHITTPFYQRMDLLDPTSISPYTPYGITAMQVAVWNHATALRVPDIQSQGEEGATVPRAPAIYAPGCGQHVGLTNTACTHMATLDDTGGMAWTVRESLVRFLLGNDFVAVDDGMPPPSSTCPPTTGDYD